MERLYSYRFYLICLLFLILPTCKDKITNFEDSNSRSIIINLDKAEYKKDEIAELSIKNNSERDLILGHCAFNPGFDVEKKVDRNWEMPYSLTCPAIGVPFYIAKDSTFKSLIHFPIFENELDSVAGIYRLKLWLKDAQNKILIADSLRVTKAFKITSD